MPNQSDTYDFFLSYARADNVSDLALLEPEQTDTLTVLGPKLHLLYFEIFLE